MFCQCAEGQPSRIAAMSDSALGLVAAAPEGSQASRLGKVRDRCGCGPGEGPCEGGVWRKKLDCDPAIPKTALWMRHPTRADRIRALQGEI
mmetsp:Transcript_68835/g.185487  ORF Transcript_68835/g.185487 Transcript_68835/m.185487 type:complete len:91 (+) Transcript_68835:226-498(+)